MYVLLLEIGCQYGHYAACYESCNMLLLGCQYGDHAAWCSTQNMAGCYLNSTATTCCATCYYYLQTGSPGKPVML